MQPIYRASYEIPTDSFVMCRKYIFETKEQMDSFTKHVEKCGGKRKSFTVDHVMNQQEAIADLNREIAHFNKL